jgi:ABC-type multidrug transport system fused ATPase/permease subunit
VIIGLFSLSACSNHFKAVVEGRVAAKLAFEVIDRESAIPHDSGDKHTIEGSIKLDNVSFFYPTRPDSKVLKNLTIEFKKG